MRTAASYFCMALGGLLILAALWVWLSFSYNDDVPIFRFFIIPSMHFVYQALNYLLACIIGSAGYGLFIFGKKLKKNHERPPTA
jgi:hypothetical protein